MYYQYFGLTEAPFSIAVNPRYLFMSPRHRDALAHLLYGVGAGGGFILLTGEVGTGKTTINRCLLEQLPDATDIAIILNPALNAMELLATVCDELGIVYDPDNHTLKTLTDALHAYLLDNHGRGRKTVLLIDEAQHLDFEVLEQIRLLTNLETHSEKLLQIILIGQPELARMLAQPELRQLNQRITARYNLEPLNLEETGAYIRHRLQVAGMGPGREVFPAAVIRRIHRHTRGIPRLINVLCDRVLLGAYGRNENKVDQAMLRLAAREVMGVEVDRPWRWVWPTALAAGLVVVLATGWLLIDTRRATAPVPLAASEVDPAGTIPRQQEMPELPEPVAIPPVTPEVAAAPTSNWLLAPAEAMSRLWELSSTGPEPAEPCSATVQAGLACVDDRAQVWDELARFDRPLLLEMSTPARFAAGVLLLGTSGRSAWVASGQGVEQVDLAELGVQWTGRYRFFWHPPQGFERPLGIGDNNPVVARVAALFARLDGQQQALSGPRFNAALEQRVRIFQRQHGLDDDGYVGRRTLLKLNELLGIDLTSARALSRLQGDSEEVVVR